MTGIIGSGFGLYGHLPAILASQTSNVMLAARYQPAFEKREELQHFAGRIVWLANETVLIRNAETVVIAVCPKQQPAYVEACLEHSSIKNLVLEKPLAVTPSLSDKLLGRIVSSGINLRIVYSFLYTNWFTELKAAVSDQDCSVRIYWQFMAHHYRHNVSTWKRNVEEGGGALRFYGIHVIALLADLGFNELVTSNTSGLGLNDCVIWQAKLKGTNGTAEITVDSFSERDLFKIEVTDHFSGKKKFELELADPFSNEEKSEGLDSRVSLNSKIYRSLDDRPNDRYYDTYSKTNSLWSWIESKNLHNSRI